MVLRRRLDAPFGMRYQTRLRRHHRVDEPVSVRELLVATLNRLRNTPVLRAHRSEAYANPGNNQRKCNGGEDARNYDPTQPVGEHCQSGHRQAG
jgi:hypothetical protein